MTPRNQTALFLSSLILAPLLLLGQPGAGMHFGDNTMLSPSVTGSIGYSSNVNLRRRAISEEGELLDRSDNDFFFDREIALSARRQGPAVRSSGRIWFSRRGYWDYDNLDRDTYGISGRSFWSTDTGNNSFSLGASLQRAIDRSESFQDFLGDPNLTQEIESVGERVERDDYRVTLSSSHQIHDRLSASLGYSVTMIDYEDDRFKDITQQDLDAGLRLSLTDSVGLKAQVTRKHIDQDEREAGWEDPSFLVGLDFDRPFNLTDKLTFRFSAGYESRRRTRRVRDGEDEEERSVTDSQIRFTGDLTYAATPKTTFALTARNGYGQVASPGGTSREEISTTASVVHRPTPQIQQRASVSWRRDEYLDPLPARGTEWDEVKETLVFRYNLTYQTPRPWLQLFGNITYEEGDSRIPGDSYTETQAIVGATLRY